MSLHLHLPFSTWRNNSAHNTNAITEGDHFQLKSYSEYIQRTTFIQKHVLKLTFISKPAKYTN